MFISVLDLFKIGVGPSSSHTLGPMVAANDFINRIKDKAFSVPGLKGAYISCTLKGSLAFTGKGHSTDRAITLGLHGYPPADLANLSVETLIDQISQRGYISFEKNREVCFSYR